MRKVAGGFGKKFVSVLLRIVRAGWGSKGMFIVVEMVYNQIIK